MCEIEYGEYKMIHSTNNLDSILIVDDSSSNLNHISNILKKQGFRSLTASDGKTAIKRTRQFKPDIILLDVVMPDIDGFETCSKLKAIKETKDIPIIFMTTQSNSEHRNKCFSAGGVDYIAKPFKKEELLTRVFLHLKMQKKINQSVNNIGSHDLQKQVDELQRINKKLKKSEEKFRKIVLSATQGIFQITTNGQILFANQALCEILGYSSFKEMTSFFTNNKQIFVDPEKQDQLIKLITHNNVVKNFEFECHKKKGTVFVSTNAHTVLDDNHKIRYIEGIMEDITLKKESEEYEISKQVTELSIKTKNNFLSNMSHEIRTPMNGVMVSSGLALDYELPPKVEEHLKYIHNSTSSLLQVLDDILDFTKIQAKQFELKPVLFQLNEVFQKASDKILYKAITKDIELFMDYDSEIPADLLGDSKRLQQVLLCLLDNAVKFTPEKGVIMFGAKKLKKSSENVIEVEFSIKDNGIGLKDKQIKQIFNAFSQVNLSTTQNLGEGIGLGLTISKQIVEIMKGKFWVESEYQKGTTFSFSIPFERQAKVCHSKLDIPDHIKDLNILIVDDFKLNISLLQKIFDSFYYKTTPAYSGEETIEILKQSQVEGIEFDLIILDWKLPGIDGIETSKIIKDDLKLNIPTILLTSYEADFKENTQESGIATIMIKPVKTSTLYETILEVFKKD